MAKPKAVKVQPHMRSWPEADKRVREQVDAIHRAALGEGLPEDGAFRIVEAWAKVAKPRFYAAIQTVRHLRTDSK